jgi:AhpD family alkylhydroperoxidase
MLAYRMSGVHGSGKIRPDQAQQSYVPRGPSQRWRTASRPPGNESHFGCRAASPTRGGLCGNFADPVRFDPYSGHAAGYYGDVRALSTRLRRSALDAGLGDLVEIRVSQITGCAFCLNLHAGIARRRGISQTKLDALAGWRESLEFTPRERAALELAEAMTRIGDGARVEDEVWAAAREVFSDEELSALLYLVGLINVWNRINIAVQLPGDYALRPD